MTGGTLAGLLLGAGLTFVAQAVLQLLIIPRVETRKRRDDRWEKNVLELGELLTKEVPEAAREAELKQYLLHYFNTTARTVEGVNLERLEQSIPAKQQEAETATRRYEELVGVQARWLAERIAAAAPEARAIMRFQIAWEVYRQKSLLCTFYRMREVEYTDERFEEDWKKQKKYLAALTAIVRELALMRHPPRASTAYLVRNFSRSKFSSAKRHIPILRRFKIRRGVRRQPDSGTD
ncbi:hypothetical protein ACTG9Q_11610 [Actinokineospora sp. 24-640]